MMDNPQQSSPPESKTSSSEDPQLSAKSFYGKRKWKKWILIYLFIAALVYAGIYYLFLSKQGLNPYSSSYQARKATPQPTAVQDETANWKNITFNNLTFKIPSGYHSGYLGSSSVFAIDPQLIPQTPSYGDLTPAFSLNLIKNKSLDQVKQEFLNQQAYTNKEWSNVTIDNKPGLKTTKILPPGQNTIDHHVYDLYLSVGQDLYHFSSFDLHISSTDQQKYFNQILSTFRFDSLTTSKFIDQGQNVTNESEVAKICKDVLKEPTNPQAGITFQRSYCQGDLCNDAKTKEQCESRDVIRIEKNMVTSGKDGRIDCRWVNPVETMHFCAPFN